MITITGKGRGGQGEWKRHYDGIAEALVVYKELDCDRDELNEWNGGLWAGPHADGRDCPDCDCPDCDCPDYDCPDCDCQCDEEQLVPDWVLLLALAEYHEVTVVEHCDEWLDSGRYCQRKPQKGTKYGYCSQHLKKFFDSFG